MDEERARLPEPIPFDPSRYDRRRVVVRPRQRGEPGHRPKYRFHRRHTPHYYLVLSGLSGAAFVGAFNIYAYASKSVRLAEISFVAVLITALVIFTAFFWGFFMVMNGHIPVRRIKYLVPHGAVGVLSPLFYTLNISFELEDLGLRPLSGLSLICSLICFGLLCVQFTMGKLVVRPERLRVLPHEAAG